MPIGGLGGDDCGMGEEPEAAALIVLLYPI